MDGIFDILKSGPTTPQDFEELRKQIESWELQPDPMPPWEIVDGIAYIYTQFGYLLMMMPEADFRQDFMGGDDGG